MKTIPTRTAATRRSIALLSGLVTLLALLLANAAPAKAQLSFTLLNDYLAGNAGDTLSYQATLTNHGTEEVFLNGDFFNLLGDDLTVDDSPFFTNFPLSLGAGESFTDEMFTVTIGPTTPQGVYTGTFSVLGGPTDTDFDPLATTTFHLAVGAPEPATGLLLLVGTAALAGIARRKTASRQ